MSFQPRSFPQILEEMIAYVEANTKFTDFEIGSAVRSILEAAALEDDEQYFQMVQLLDAFSFNTAEREDLDRRLADFDIIRKQPEPSSGKIIVQDRTLITNTLEFDVSVASLTLTLNDSSTFPTSGYNYTVRVGEGTLNVEDLLVSNNNTGTGVLTLVSGAVNTHASEDRVSYVSGTADKPINTGLQEQVAATGVSSPIIFTTVESGVIINGNYQSLPISTKATVPGVAGNIGIGQISQFTSSPPFTGAGVTNVTRFTGGTDLESDPDLRARARLQIRSLSKGTVLALKQGSLGVSDPVTGQKANTVNVLEDFINEEVIVYVDDGTGFTPDIVALASSTLTIAIVGATVSVVVADASDFPTQGYVILSPESASQIENRQYTSVNYSTNTLTLSTNTSNTHDIGDEVVLVDPVTLNAEAGANFEQFTQFPVVRNSERIWIDNGAGPLRNMDYFLNRGDGQVQFENDLVASSVVLANYSYYTGLISQVQKVIDGDDNDPVNFPGIRSAGVIVVTETPVIRRIAIRLSISAQQGFKEDDLKPLVQETIENYISSLGIGNDVIMAEVITAAMEIPGVADVVLINPTQNITIIDEELPVPFDSDGDSLITVA